MERNGSIARACPICRSEASVPRINLNRSAQAFEIARCRHCGFVYVRNPKGQTFEPVEAAPSAVPERARHRQIKRVCDHGLARRLRSGATCRIMEVGAGWGGLAQVFARDARYRYTGLEPSAARAEFCRARGLPVREGLFLGPDSLEGPADAIIFDNVLEHVEDPDGLVRSAVESLREGGLLIVIVPNVRDVRQLKRSWRDRHLWQPHCHINYFSAADLERMFRRYDLSFRFFGVEAVGGAHDDLELLPRILVDALGLHFLGLNVYGIKASAGA